MEGVGPGQGLAVFLVKQCRLRAALSADWGPSSRPNHWKSPGESRIQLLGELTTYWWMDDTRPVGARFPPPLYVGGEGELKLTRFQPAFALILFFSLFFSLFRQL